MEILLRATKHFFDRKAANKSILAAKMGENNKWKENVYEFLQCVGQQIVIIKVGSNREN